MCEGMEDVFRIDTEGAADLRSRLRSGRDSRFHRRKDFEEFAGSLLASLHPGLVISIHIDERGIKTDRAFEGRNHGPQCESVHPRQTERHVLPAVFKEGAPRAAEIT